MVPPVSLTGEDSGLDGLAKANLVLPSSSLWTEIPARPSRTSPRSLPPDLSALSIFSKKSHGEALFKKKKKRKKVKVESEKAGLKLNIQKMKTMASGPITSWEIDGETVETASDFIFLGSKITADGNCSHEIKRCLLLGRKVMTN